MAVQSVFAWHTVRANRDASDWVQHTEQVLALAGETRFNLINMQTAYRGYLLTGDDP